MGQIRRAKMPAPNCGKRRQCTTQPPDRQATSEGLTFWPSHRVRHRRTRTEARRSCSANHCTVQLRSGLLSSICRRTYQSRSRFCPHDDGLQFLRDFRRERLGPMFLDQMPNPRVGQALAASATGRPATEALADRPAKERRRPDNAEGCAAPRGKYHQGRYHRSDRARGYSRPASRVGGSDGSSQLLRRSRRQAPAIRSSQTRGSPHHGSGSLLRACRIERARSFGGGLGIECLGDHCIRRAEHRKIDTECASSHPSKLRHWRRSCCAW